MAGKAGLPANEGAVDAEEPGAVDNRISWVPSEFPATEGWEDGGIYKLPAFGKGVTVRQISPGEGELIPPAQPEEAEEEAAPAPKKRGGYGNPAIEALAEE
jgi:hypothetical protein